jgi:predicted  nucleic acid-binding Zn-ribbon protein
MNQPTLIDLTGKRFGHWTVLQQASARYENSQVTMWLCRCDCGTVREVNGQRLRDGRSKSCGCNKERYRKETRERSVMKPMKKANEDIRQAAKAAGVRLWMVADELGIQDSVLSRNMRHELPDEKKKEILDIIKRLEEESI